MTCTKARERLFLAAHSGENPFRAIPAWLHARKCASCRLASAEMLALSGYLAAHAKPGAIAWKAASLAKAFAIHIALGAIIVGASATAAVEARDYFLPPQGHFVATHPGQLCPDQNDPRKN